MTCTGGAVPHPNDPIGFESDEPADKAGGAAKDYAGAVFDMAKNWNDARTGRIVGSGGRVATATGADVGGAGEALAGAGEAAGAAAGIGELAELAPLALL
jgi:hypothetical protein